jgi:glyoxylase I family protein
MNGPARFQSPQINLYVADLEASVRFYRDLLGFAETFRAHEDGAAVHVELRLDGFTLGVADASAAARMHGLTPGSGHPQAELVVWTDDVDAAFSALSDGGATAISEPHDFLDSLRSAWVADPDGNPVQLVMRRAAAGSH